MTTARSASAMASSCEWVTCTNVIPSSVCHRLSSARIFTLERASPAITPFE
jgi:hypothetical protein